MRAIEWDSPGDQSVTEYYAKDPNIDATPHAGSVLSARFKGLVARVRVDAYTDGTSYGEVVALIDPETGKRLTEHQGIAVSDSVALPDAKRSFEPNLEPEEEADEDEDSA
jgi:hypothetical protein